jgi:plasmid stabilization system protein ParE
MPDKYRVNYSRRAAEQLQEIVSYIERDSPDNAAKMAGRLVKAIESLKIFPHRFNVAANLGGPGSTDPFHACASLSRPVSNQ